MSFGFSFSALAQGEDEIVVTGSRISSGNSSDVFLEKKGDYLLLEVSIENDSRELSTRLSEMEATLGNIIKAAANDPEIELSLIDDNNFVRPLSQDTFKSGITQGRRPDTSIAHLKVKTNIPNNVEDSFKLAVKLANFVDGIEEEGRTKISTYNDVAVSVVNPYQYRDELRAKVLADIRATADALGPDYRVILHGMDNGMRWSRSGDLNLAFYMDYSYEIIPATLTMYYVNE